MGAPGSYYWTGTVKVFNMTSNTHYNLNQDNLSLRRYSYLGNTCSDINNHFNIPCCSHRFVFFRVCCDCWSLLLPEYHRRGGWCSSRQWRWKSEWCLAEIALLVSGSVYITLTLTFQNCIFIHILGLHLQNRRNVSCEDL